MKCIDCKHWGEGSGTGIHYDAGAMNYCNHPGIAGVQHPSYGACDEEVTMIYTNTGNDQSIMTRRNFGCVLFKKANHVKEKK